MGKPTRGFDGTKLFDALDSRRGERGLTWTGVALDVWDLSRALNRRRPGDHPFSTSSINRLRRTGKIGCQHALLLLWWLDASPEDFVNHAEPTSTGVPLPVCDSDHRLRWQLTELHASLDAKRSSEGATWIEVASQLGCSSGQVTGLRTARYATNMHLAMSITQLLRRPAADFVHSATW